jgi:hypothetical protein
MRWLRVSPSCILNFPGFSSMSEAERDLAADLGLALAGVLSALEETHAARDAFAVRRELVNFKKASLHLWRDAAAVEKALRVAAPFYFADLTTGPAAAPAAALAPTLPTPRVEESETEGTAATTATATAAAAEAEAAVEAARDRCVRINATLSQVCTL